MYGSMTTCSFRPYLTRVKTSAHAVLDDYHVTDRGKGYSDDDEDGRSRAYPSRTRYGAAGGDGKARQYLVMRKDFFFGLLSVYDWEWLWGRTAAQIELRTIDQPIVVYKKDDKKPKPWEGGKVSKEYADKAYQKWLEGKKKRDREGTGLNLGKTLGKATKMNFDEYLRKGEEKEK